MAWTKRFNSKNNQRIAASIDPTNEEYDELRKLDVHPPSFDKATVKRMRNSGIPHTDLIDAAKQFIPMEDYEESRLNNPSSHLAATEEARAYQDFYQDHMETNRKFINENPEYNATQGITLSPENHRGLLGKVVLHHLAVKNMPEFDEKHPADFPGRRRGSKWILNECSKLDPEAFGDAHESEHFDPSWIMKPDTYSKAVRQLGAHHMKEMLNAGTMPEYYRAKRKLKVIDHLAVSQFSPYGYTPEMYEE